jgi:adenosylhomocysteinase
MNKGRLNVDLYDVPEEIDREVARLKLEAMQLGMDKLTPEQADYFFGTGD